jgi:predicted phage-related endonuclease
MSIEVLIPASREEWLAARKLTIGASESAALLGQHPYLTLRELWAIKTGEIEDVRVETPAMKRGRLLERVAVEFLQEERADWTITANKIPGGKFFRDVEIGLSATPDAFISDPRREGFGICQIKSVGPIVFENDWGGAYDPQVPDAVAIQAIQEAMLTGASFAYVAALIVAHGIDLHLIEIPIHSGLVARLQAEAKDFWRRIKEDRPPEFDFRRDVTLVTRLYGKTTAGKEIDLSGKNDLPELAEEYAKLGASIKVDEAERKSIKARFLAELQDAEIGRFNGQILVTAKLVRKPEYMVKAQEFRLLTVKEAHA